MTRVECPGVGGHLLLLLNSTRKSCTDVQLEVAWDKGRLGRFVLGNERVR